MIRGHVSVENKTLEDFVLLRSNGTPTFLLANVVDDADMGITHVVRGEEHVNGTPKYLCLGDALGLEYRPDLRPPPRARERAAQEAVEAARRRLGRRSSRTRATCPPRWSTTWPCSAGGRTTASRSARSRRSVEQFRLEDVNSSPAFFDVKKLQHVNAEHLRALPEDAFLAAARPFLTLGDAALKVLDPIAPLVQERVRLLTEVEPMIAFLLDEPLELDEDSWTKAMVKGKAAPEMLDATIAALEGLDPWSADGIRAAIEGAAVAVGLVNAEGQAQLSKAQGPVRVATTGRSVGPPLFESLEALGQERTIARLRAARECL